ncbi:MAG: hypothetical protein HC792_04895 [Acaryochloridaceae cyanobacterium CSU_5_19]|nr:hypothetical protein [Acaryochloridaceae cyanobacterium CSU_5_19]
MLCCCGLNVGGGRGCPIAEKKDRTAAALGFLEKEKSVNWLAEPNLCPGLFYGTPAQDGLLIRIRRPGGWLNLEQGQAIATLAQQWNCTTLQVTNRANLQLRGIQTPPSRETLQTLQARGVSRP